MEGQRIASQVIPQGSRPADRGPEGIVWKDSGSRPRWNRTVRDRLNGVAPPPEDDKKSFRFYALVVEYLGPSVPDRQVQTKLQLRESGVEDPSR